MMRGSRVFVAIALIGSGVQSLRRKAKRGAVKESAVIADSWPGDRVDEQPAPAPTAAISQFADQLITETLKCATARNQSVSVVVAGPDGAAVETSATPNSASANAGFAQGKVNWLVEQAFDTSTLCQDSACQWFSLLEYFRTNLFKAQGSVVLRGDADEVLGVLAVAGNPSQFDDVACAQEGAVNAGWTAKEGSQFEFDEPAVALIGTRKESAATSDSWPRDPVDEQPEPAPPAAISEFADKLITETLNCATARNQSVSVVVAGPDGAAVEASATPNSASANANFAQGKVNWLVHQGFDTSTLCQDAACQWFSLLRYLVTDRFKAQGSVVLRGDEDEVLGVLAVAGNPSQFDDVACAQEGAVNAGWTAKDSSQLEFDEPVQ